MLGQCGTWGMCHCEEPPAKGGIALPVFALELPWGLGDN